MMGAMGTEARATVTMPTDREIRSERVFDAARDRVWRAYTEPELLAQWWGRGNKLVIERFELERGGHWRFVEHSDHGEHGFEGRFREVSPQDRLVYTFEWDGMPGYVVLETAEFEPIDGDRTKVVATALFFSTEERDGMVASGMEQGMNESYAALDRLLASME
ncbi:MAG TPA: SRPBCC family protein [Longimicrobiales bacterium]